MHDTILTDEISKLDLSKIAALQQKRTLAFVNHFVITTVQFLNNFMRRCEQKLMDFEKKLEKVEASMVLLEARLSSIPEINTPQTEAKTVETTTADPVTEVENKTETNESPEDSKDSKVLDVLPPEFERFLKMVQVGVPLPAVKLKAGIEGLDADLLEKFLSK